MPTIPNYQDLPARDLTIYLLKEAVTEADVVPALAGFREYPITAGRIRGRLFVKAVRNNTGPRWAGLFEDQVEPGSLGLLASVSATLLLRVSDRLFALTFGHAHLSFDDTWFEERFGFYTVLNLVSADQIRSVDKKSLESVGRQTRVQTTRGATVREFGVDYERDLLRAVVGTPTERDLGTRVVGSTAVRTSVRIDLTHLPQLLKRYLDESTSRSYRRKFPGIDQLLPVNDTTTVARLNLQVVRALNDGSIDSLALAIPEVIDWQHVSTFRYQGLHDTTEHYELSLDDILALARDAQRRWSDDDLDRVRVVVMDADGLAREQWSLRKCLFGQFQWHGKQWILSSGLWYSVVDRLVDEVNGAFDALDRLPGLPAFDHSTEADYCRALADSDNSWALMDRAPVTFGGGRSSIEFCDLFNLGSSTLLHIKRYAGSSPLSHLFQQALVSGETFKTVAEFRRLVNDKLPETHRLNDYTTAPEGFTVALGIVKTGAMTLPFFSKVTLRNTVRLLRGFGFSVALAHIEVAQARALTAVARRPAQRRR